MSQIKTVLFDFDGTLADTNHLISQSYLHVLGKYFPGQYEKEESVKHFNGPSLEEVFSRLLPDKSEQLVEEYRTFNHAKHDELIREFPDVPLVLGHLKEQGLKLAVVSTKNSYILNHGLKLLNIEKYFDVILGGTDFEKVKPDPESLNLAMEKLNARPETTIMIGDNPQDIEAANRANVRGVFVEWSRKTMEEVLPYKPYITVKNMLDLEEWILSQNNGGSK